MRGFRSLITRHDVGQRLFEGKLLDVVNLVVGKLERRHDIVLGDQDALDEKLLLIGLVGGDLIGQVSLPEARILRRQQDRAFQNAVAHRLETFLRAVHGHEHDLPLPTAARDHLGGGHGQAVAVAIDQIERGVGGHPVFSDRDRLGRIPVGRVLRDDLDAWISRHYVGEAAGAVGIEALSEQALQVGDLALHLAIFGLEQLRGVFADDLSGMPLVEAEHCRAALDLRVKADDRHARSGGLLHRRPEGARVYEVDRDGVNALVNKVFDGLDLLVHVAFAAGDDQAEAEAARRLLGAVNLAQVEGIAEIDLNETNLRWIVDGASRYRPANADQKRSRHGRQKSRHVLLSFGLRPIFGGGEASEYAQR